MDNKKGEVAVGLKKTLTLWDFFTIGFGACIGTGWVLLSGDWVTLAGGPLGAIIAFAIGAVCLLPMSFVFGEMGAAIPVSGGTVVYTERAFGKKASYYTGWLIAMGKAIICPWETIAISTLLSERFSEFFPILHQIKLYSIMGADVYLIPTVIAVGVGVFVSYLNFKGASSAAKLTGFIFKALMLGMALAMAISLVKGSPANLLPVFERVEGTSATGMVAGVISVLVMTPFFFSGFDTAPQQAGEASDSINWRKFANVVGVALLCVGLFYIATIYSFSTIVPWTTYVTMPVPALAVLKNISIVLYVVMLTIATLGPIGPMNSSYGATARILMAMAQSKQIPDGFAKVSPKSGTPVLANIVLAVLTCAGPLLGKKMLLPLTNVSSLCFIISYTVVCFACLKLRKSEPDLERPYRVPGGIAGIVFACISGAVIIGLMVVPTSPAALKPIEWIITLAWVAIGIVLSIVSGNKRKSAPQ